MKFITNNDFLPFFAVSTFYRIGCFNHKANVIPPLKDAKRQLKPKNSFNPEVIKCAERAEEKGYKYFSVGLKGVCYSGPNANETYFTKGAAHRKKCGEGIGKKKDASVVYTFGKSCRYGNNALNICQPYATDILR